MRQSPKRALSSIVPARTASLGRPLSLAVCAPALTTSTSLGNLSSSSAWLRNMEQLPLPTTLCVPTVFSLVLAAPCTSMCRRVTRVLHQLVVSACGFDSIPADMGTLFTMEEFARAGGVASA